MNVFAKLLFGAALFFSVSLANAQNVDGVLRVVKGDVQIKSAKTGQTVKARIGEKVYPKDVVITGKDSRAKIVMVDNNELNVSPESQIEIQHYEFDPAAGKKDVLLNVIYGKVRAKVEQKYDGKSSKFQVKTPSAVAGVRGTDFLTSYNKVDKSSQVVTFRGAVEFGLPGPNGTIQNPVSVTPGKMASAAAGVPPSTPKEVSKTELAKVDNETKADTGGSAPKSDRQPSNDGGGSKGDKDKQDSGSGDKSGDKNGGGDKSAAGDKNGGTDKNAAGDKNGGGDKRAPASTSSPSGGGGTGPGPSVGFDPKLDSATNQDNNPKILPGPTGPSAGACPGGTCAPPAQLPKCETCNSLIQNGNTKVNVHIK